jgi:DNA-nicking Smr family endonuclease
MNDSDGPLKHNPLEALGALLKKKAVLCPISPAQPNGSNPSNASEPAVALVIKDNEEGAFREAMAGVQPMARDKYCERKPPPILPSNHPVSEPEDDLARQRLENLVKYGEGFIISQTPEYVEGIGCDIPPEFAARLHRGDFSIQAHLDLHGLSAAQAKEAFENFLQGALRSGKRGVQIIHGRGISSPGDPVLKMKVVEWLTRSHWRKWVIAFASAQSYDGGAGATYVLLRHRRLAKEPRKK